MSYVPLLSNTDELVGHAPTGHSSCDTPAQALMSSLNKFSIGGVGGLSAPATCPPGSTPMCAAQTAKSGSTINAPIRPVHPAAGKAPAHPSAATLSPATANIGGQTAAANGIAYANHEAFQAAMAAQARKGLTHSDLVTLSEKKAGIRVIAVPIELPYTLEELQADPSKSTFNVPWSVISGGKQTDTRGALVSVVLKSKSGGKPCGVRLDVQGADSSDHMEYHPTHRAHAITWFGAGEDARAHFEKGEKKFERSWSGPIAEELKHAGISYDEMFNKNDMIYVELPDRPYYQVRANSKLGRSIVKSANAERAMPAGSDKVFDTHPSTWKALQSSADPRDAWWPVAPHIIENLQQGYKDIKDKECLVDMSKGINITASRADGMAWNSPVGVVDDLENSAQTDALTSRVPLKAELELAVLVPTGSQ